MGGLPLAALRRGGDRRRTSIADTARRVMPWPSSARPTGSGVPQKREPPHQVAGALPPLPTIAVSRATLQEHLAWLEAELRAAGLVEQLPE